MRQNLSKRQSGMSLIEVLVSVLIFSLGILGLMGLQARAVQFSVSAEDSNRAALLANELGTTLWTSGSVTPAAATLAAWQARVADPTVDGLPNGLGAVVVNGNSAEITITWRATSAPAGTVNRFTTQVTIP